MSGTYSDVDASADPSGAVQWQDRIDQWPHIRAYKHHIRDLLAGADRLVDVGCGPGADVMAIGTDRCVGVDRSAVMCDAAKARGVTVARADCHRLPFPTGCFGGAVADRVLQHAARPARALEELVRVLRPGGRLVIADPDQETLTLSLPGVRQELIDRVKALRRDIGYRNGRFVSSVSSALAGLGMGDISVDPFALSLTDPDNAFGLPGWVKLWQEHGAFSNDDLLEWQRGVERSREGGFLYSLIYFVVSGVRMNAPSRVLRAEHG